MLWARLPHTLDVGALLLGASVAQFFEPRVRNELNLEFPARRPRSSCM
jgi:hypothetical protein